MLSAAPIPRPAKFPSRLRVSVGTLGSEMRVRPAYLSRAPFRTESIARRTFAKGRRPRHSERGESLLYAVHVPVRGDCRDRGIGRCGVVHEPHPISAAAGVVPGNVVRPVAVEVADRANLP